MRLTRFLRNPAVSAAEICRTARARVADLAAGRHVLAIQDTTVTRSEGGGGSYLHAMIAVDAADGVVLGPLDAQFLLRDEGLRRHRSVRRFEDKESHRWLAATELAGAALAQASRITVVADREADIWALFAHRPVGVDLVVRAAHDRALEDGGRLFATTEAWPEAGRLEVDAEAKPGQKARVAQLALRFGPAVLRQASHGAGAERRSGTLGVWLVDLREVDPPKGVTPLHWRLLTTHEVERADQAMEIAAIYRRRWLIEQVFRLLKTKGFDIEALQIEAEEPRNKLIAACLVAACSVQAMVQARDGSDDMTTPLRPITDAFQPEEQPILHALSQSLEGKTLRQKNPHPPESLAFAAWVMARLGGWNCYYGKPGPITILEGWIEFQAIKRGATLSWREIV
jgi:hypothetical protein